MKHIQFDWQGKYLFCTSKQNQQKTRQRDHICSFNMRDFKGKKNVINEMLFPMYFLSLSNET
jgi:hypothetical protein